MDIEKEFQDDIHKAGLKAFRNAIRTIAYCLTFLEVFAAFIIPFLALLEESWLFLLWLIPVAVFSFGTVFIISFFDAMEEQGYER